MIAFVMPGSAAANYISPMDAGCTCRERNQPHGSAVRNMEQSNLSVMAQRKKVTSPRYKKGHMPRVCGQSDYIVCSIF